MSNGLVCGFVWWEWYQGRLQAHRCQNPEAHTGGQWMTTGMTLTRGAQSKIRVPRGGLTFDRRRHD